jgi:hypothetical protein
MIIIAEWVEVVLAFARSLWVSLQLLKVLRIERINRLGFPWLFQTDTLHFESSVRVGKIGFVFILVDWGWHLAFWRADFLFGDRAHPVIYDGLQTLIDRLLRGTSGHSDTHVFGLYLLLRCGTRIVLSSVCSDGRMSWLVLVVGAWARRDMSAVRLRRPLALLLGHFLFLLQVFWDFFHKVKLQILV